MRDIDELIVEITALHTAGEHVPLADFITRCPHDNDSLSDLVDADAEARLSRGLPVNIDLYAEAIPDLRQRPEVLDAVLSRSLAALMRDRRCTQEQAIEALCAAQPDLSDKIRITALLSKFIWSTDALADRIGFGRTLDPPCAIGPPMPSGEPRYEVRRLIGRGAHGDVYEGVDRLLSDSERPAWIAIKVLREPAGADTDRFDAEARKARGIDHPNVARVLDLGRTPDRAPFIVYEYLEGGPLTLTTTSTPREAALLVLQVARGVQAAHTARLIHRDIKPANILLTRDGVPKISDFGLASRIHAERTNAHTLRGTPAFVAPEQYRAEPAGENFTVDVYALAGVLYWLLTGRPPNGVARDEIFAYLDGHTQRRVRPSEHVPTDPDLDAVCARALHPDPARRHQSADQFAADLEAYLAHSPIEWTNPSRVRRVKLLLCRRPLAVATAGLAALAIVAVASGFVYIAQKHQQENIAADARTEAAALRAEVAEADERAIEAENRAIKKSISSMIAAVQASKGSLAHDWLPMVTVFESLAGPVITERDEQGAPLWERRIEVVRGMLDEAEQAGHGDDIDTAIWRILLSYWLLHDGQMSQSLKLVRETKTQWEATGWPDSPWITYMRTIESCDTLAEQLPSRSAPRSAYADLDDQAISDDLDELTQLETEYTGMRAGNRLHLTLLIAIRRGADAIGRDDLSRYARLKLDTLTH